MTTEAAIHQHLDALPGSKGADMRRLHALILAQHPGCRLWFLDGRDARGKVVSNPSIGYGTLSRRSAGGKVRELFQAGISANTTGLSVYLMGMGDRDHLRETYGPTLGKARVSGYCITFRSLEEIDLEVLMAAIRDGMGRTGA